MIAYVIRRLIYTIPILIGVSLIIFALFNLVGGDPTDLMLGRHATLQQKIELRAQLGLDRVWYLQYVDFLQQIITFDFGRSYSTKQRVSEMILQGMPASLSLTMPAFFIETIFAVIISLIVSFYRGKFIDRAAVILCVIGMSISSLAYILFGQYVFAYKLGWFPISGYSDDPIGKFQYVALPALIWVFVGLGLNVRVFRTFILDEISHDYVRTARAKGLTERVVLFRHVLKNALIPILTYTVIEIPFLITGSFLLESFFGIPGLGSITIDAINNSDFPVIKAIKKHSKKPLDVHLMIVRPEQYILQFKDAGADVLSVHIEVCPHLHRTIQEIKNAGMQAGVAINPHTNIALLEDIIADIDLVCMMSVNPGFGGQKFIENTFQKIDNLKDLIIRRNSSAKIEIDGGVDLKNAAALISAGADVLVAGNTVFSSSDPVATIKQLKAF